MIPTIRPPRAYRVLPLYGHHGRPVTWSPEHKPKKIRRLRPTLKIRRKETYRVTPNRLAS